MKYAVGSCTIDSDAYEIRRDGALVPVEPQVFELLILLLRHRDRLVGKDEIFREVWQGRLVSDAALSSRMRSLREALGDDGAAQTLIRTIRGRGFRFVGEVGEITDAATNGGGQASDHGGALPLPPGRIAPATLGMPTGPGIAVLRFESPAGEEALNFFGHALAEEIVTELTRFSELRVAAHTPTAEHVGAGIDPGHVARTLGAEFLVTGSLRCADDRVRVTAQLTKAADATVLWAEAYERHLTPADIFAVQEDVAGKVVAAIGSIAAGAIARDRLAQVRGKPPRALSAYESAIRANEIMAQGFTAESHREIRDCLEAALAAEPDYAAAWAMLAWIHTYEYSQGYNGRPGPDPRERALACARRAVDLAPGNPMARFAMAHAAYLMRDLDVFAAEAARALSLNPHEPFLLGNLGNWLAFTGRWEEGVALVRKAIALNPKVYPRWWHAALGKDHYRRGDYRAALIEFKTMNLPNWTWNLIELAYTYGQLGEIENAHEALARLTLLYPDFDLEKAAEEHRKFCFQQSYIDHALDGLRKAGVPERAAAFVPSMFREIELPGRVEPLAD